MANNTLSRTPEINEKARQFSDELLSDKKFMETVCLMTGMKFPTPETKRLLQEIEELKAEYESTLPTDYPGKRGAYTSAKQRLFDDITKKTDELRNVVRDDKNSLGVKSPGARRSAAWNKVTGLFPVLPEVSKDETVLIKGRFRDSGLEAFYTGKFLGQTVSQTDPEKAQLRWFINMPFEEQSMKDQFEVLFWQEIEEPR